MSSVYNIHKLRDNFNHDYGVSKTTELYCHSLTTIKCAKTYPQETKNQTTK
jgi:hypothetical protein